jgi:predicted nucleic acid-binding protein
LNPSVVTPIDVFKNMKEFILSKAQVFDCVLAVTAKENNVDTIYTENVTDFKHFKFVKVKNPFVH